MTLEEFFAIVDSIEPNEKGCKIWPFHKDTSGYANPRIGKKMEKGNRLSLARKLGRHIKEGFHALHTCDVRCCVNPDHLWEGTPKDNAEDRDKKGRFVPLIGNKNGMFGITGQKHHFFGKTGKEHPAFGKNLGANNKASRQIIELDTEKVFDTIIEAAEFYKVHAPNITKVCRGERKQTGGHRFAYLEKEKI